MTELASCTTAATVSLGSLADTVPLGSLADAEARVVVGGDETAAARAAACSTEHGKFLAGLGLDSCECAESVRRKAGAPCSGGEILSAITEFVGSVESLEGRKAPQPGGAAPGSSELLPSAKTPESKAVVAAAALLNCDSESCVVSHPAFREFAEPKIGEAKIEANLDQRFKTEGPRDSRKWLSNHNIDETLKRWSLAFPEFHHCPFSMIDFERTGGPLARLDVAGILGGKSKTCIGGVINTGASSGKGKHWVCFFVDARESRDSRRVTVEYFNSTGRPPPKQVVEWMEKTRASLLQAPGSRFPRVDTVVVTRVPHQNSNTECGMYALYYIRCRLVGRGYETFERDRIPDAAMADFRKFVFRRV